MKKMTDLDHSLNDTMVTQKPLMDSIDYDTDQKIEPKLEKKEKESPKKDIEVNFKKSMKSIQDNMIKETMENLGMHVANSINFDSF